jgi:hypothetical protein
MQNKEWKKLTTNFPVFSILLSGNVGSLICREGTNRKNYTFSTYLEILKTLEKEITTEYWNTPPY